VADDPDPQPIGLASDLIASDIRAILIIDNCPPALHRRLSELCRAPPSQLSLVTVEYDIRDDDPEETDVFRLEPASVDLIEKLVRARFKPISQVDARTIAEFSGGNARIAIALANTIDKNETIAGLTDDELFGRLFQQRHEHDASLLLVGQACSLLYSFQGEAISGNEAELPTFAAVIGKSVDDVFHCVAELQSRDLVQQRGIWRAVLPHAIANRLAGMGLKNLPRERLETYIVQNSTARMLKSFSRRLGYLHDNGSAVEIVTQWLTSGVLSDLINLSDLRMAMLENVAPVAPERVISAIECATPEQLPFLYRFARIVRSIAFDPKLFARCVELLVCFGRSRSKDGSVSEIGRAVTSLFWIVLSGTHANIEQRIEIVEALLRSDEAYRRAVGIRALRSILEALHFGPAHGFDFGARPRDYGFWPKTAAELKHWYISALKLVESIGLSDLPMASEVRNTFAGQFRGLWTQPLIRDDLDRICREFSKGGFWREGWTAVRQVIRYDASGMSEPERTKLVSLEKDLAPRELLERVRGIVLSGNTPAIELDDVEDDPNITAGLARLDALAVTLGRETARSPDVLKKLLPELATGRGRLWMFGRGLSGGTDDPETLWRSLANEFASAPQAERNTDVLCGMLQELSGRHPEVANRLLDDAIAEEPLAPWFPELQTAVAIDKRGADRLKQSLVLGKAPAWRYRVLASGGASAPIPAVDLKDVILAIAGKTNGHDVALDVHYMRIFGDLQNKKPVAPELIEAGRELLANMAWNFRDNETHRVTALIKQCLTGSDGWSTFVTVCDNFKQALSEHQIYSHNSGRLFQALFKAQTTGALDAFLGAGDADQLCQAILDASRHHPNPLNTLPITDLTAWCNMAPAERFPLMARVVGLFKGTEDEPQTEWTDGALAVLENAPDRAAVLKEFFRRLRPMSWSGSRAVAMEMRLPLLHTLKAHADPTIVALATAEETRLRAEIDIEREHERQEDRQADERFE
jgi:hypothetical protein